MKFIVTYSFPLPVLLYLILGSTFLLVTLSSSRRVPQRLVCRNKIPWEKQSLCNSSCWLVSFTSRQVSFHAAIIDGHITGNNGTLSVVPIRKKVKKNIQFCEKYDTMIADPGHAILYVGLETQLGWRKQELGGEYFLRKPFYLQLQNL